MLPAVLRDGGASSTRAVKGTRPSACALLAKKKQRKKERERRKDFKMRFSCCCCCPQRGCWLLSLAFRGAGSRAPQLRAVQHTARPPALAIPHRAQRLEGSPERRQLNEAEPVGDGGIPFHKHSARQALSRAPRAAVWLSPARISPHRRQDSDKAAGQGPGSAVLPGCSAAAAGLHVLLEQGCSRAPCAGLSSAPALWFSVTSTARSGLAAGGRAAPQSSPIASRPSQHSSHTQLPPPRWGSLAPFPAKLSALQSLPGCCETPSAGRALAAGQGRGHCARCCRSWAARGSSRGRFHPGRWAASLAAQPGPSACQPGGHSLPQDPPASAAAVGRRELRGGIRPSFLPIQFETS
ncbi:uncharacterized protein LOC121347052 isoform X2 [Onychostruthus taczanowskii]|uniref:uncharacterized protein LOC121347052 isoform X2 n=1 Tax=Onychostruthus taczanowskii TaxID=356909 RepID=UPI001B80BA8A|nr:uncharacterized protein LOC121347052 isoform X2 [Onychostruthus taczanowskii]